MGDVKCLKWWCARFVLSSATSWAETNVASHVAVLEQSLSFGGGESYILTWCWVGVSSWNLITRIVGIFPTV